MLSINNKPMMHVSHSKSEYLRNFVFGVEDSLVSTVGLVSGVAATGMSRDNIILTGAVLIFVEAFSMGVGALLSENSVEEYQGQHAEPLSRDLSSAAVMFFSYLVSGFVVVLPYLFLERGYAIPVSIALSLLGLFALGVISARLSRTSLFKKGMTMAVIGGLAIVIGIIVGLFVDRG